MAQMVVALGHGGIYLLRPEGARKPKYGTVRASCSLICFLMMSIANFGMVAWTAHYSLYHVSANFQCIIANYKYEDVDRCMMSKFKRGVCFWTADNITHFLLSDEDRYGAVTNAFLPIYFVHIRAKELESLIRIYLSEFRAITEGEGSSVYDRMPQETTLKVITEGEEDADGNENSTES
jgi:hypothetical protein